MISTNKRLFTALLLISIIALSGAAAEDKPDQRIICWGRGNSLVLDALYLFPEAANSVIAMGEGTQAGGSFQQLLDPDFADKAVLAMELQPETVASYNPSHVILKGYMRMAAKNVEALGIPIIYIDMESPEQYDRDLSLMGELFDNEARAEELKTYFKTRRLFVENKAAAIDTRDKPRVLFLYYSMNGGSRSLMVPPSEWLQTRMIEWSGGIPVWLDSVMGKSWQTVSFEQIAAWNPDTIFLVSYHTDIEVVKQQLETDPLWQMLRAQREDRLYAFPGDYLSWDQPDPRWILGLYWIGSKLHPQIFPMTLVEQKLYEFYNTAYNFSRSDVDKLIIPKITGDYR
jgi:iron complex transport system substrate-binding protein